MKLLFTQDALNNGGAERSHLEIVSRFSSAIEVTLVYFYPKHDLKEEYEKAGVRLIFLGIPESYHFYLAVSRLIKLINCEKPDLLISSLYRADIITRIASLITRVPLIGTLVNDSYSLLAWNDKKGLKHKLVYWLDRVTSGIPTHWIANSKALASSHVNTLGLDAEKISVVYRGRTIPEQKWENKRGEMGRLEKERSNPYSFISYGRLLERKGFQDAIQAFSIVIQKHPFCTLTIYGEGPFRPQLETLIAKLDLNGKVSLPGTFPKESHSNSSLKSSNLKISNLQSPKPNSLNLLLSSDCFLFPSWYEGFSGALVEAMMAGIPIITSDIAMNLEAVEDMKTALSYRVADVDQLFEKMLFAIENPGTMEALGRKARGKAIQSFSISAISSQYEGKVKEIYQQRL